MICLYPLSAHRDPANGAVVVRPPPMLPFILADPNLVLELSGYRPIRGAPFDCQGVLWFTGQIGVYGRLDPKIGMMAVFDAPRGAGLCFGIEKSSPSRGWIKGLILLC